MFFLKLKDFSGPSDNGHSSHLDILVEVLQNLAVSLRVHLWERRKARKIASSMGLDDIGVMLDEEGYVDTHQSYFPRGSEFHFECPAIVRLARGARGGKVAWCWRCREVLLHLDEEEPTTIEEYLRGI